MDVERGAAANPRTRRLSGLRDDCPFGQFRRTARLFIVTLARRYRQREVERREVRLTHDQTREMRVRATLLPAGGGDGLSRAPVSAARPWDDALSPLGAPVPAPTLNKDRTLRVTTRESRRQHRAPRRYRVGAARGSLAPGVDAHAAPIAVRRLHRDALPDGLSLDRSRDGRPYTGVVAFVTDAGALVGRVFIPAAPDGTIEAKAMRRAVAELPAPAARSAAGAQPAVSVVVTTCAQTFSVIRCVASLLESPHPPAEVIVVENRPATSDVAEGLARSFGGDARLRYVEEPRRGLSHARNRGAVEAVSDVVAFTDDDVVCDPGWVAAIARGFASPSRPAAVSGLILPMELETAGQVLLEQFAGSGKGFVPASYSLERPPADDPLFPLAPGGYGSGANLAFRADTFRELGGFDARLGAGTPSAGGEDLDILIRALRRRWAVEYTPDAIVWHEHPSTNRRLERQVFDYGVGLSAMLTKHLISPDSRREVLRRIPAAVRHLRDPASREQEGECEGYPRRLDAIERVGMLYGPVAYARALAASRRTR